MRVFTILMLALFPFAHHMRYHATVVSCDQEEIRLKSEGQEIQVALFNVVIHDEKGWVQTCSLLYDAEKITFEIDPSTKREEVLFVYLFADDALLQEELLKKDNAKIAIHNPTYTYEKQMEEAAQNTEVMAEAKIESSDSLPKGVVYLLILYLIFILLFVLFYMKKKSDRQL